MPHDAFNCSQLCGVQGVVPHRLGPPPPQNCPSGQAPHANTPPHPSGADPHFAPSFAHVFFSQTWASGSDPSPTAASGFFAAGDADSDSEAQAAAQAMIASRATMGLERRVGVRRSIGFD